MTASDSHLIAHSIKLGKVQAFDSQDVIVIWYMYTTRTHFDAYNGPMTTQMVCSSATRIRGSSCGETCAISVADAPELLRSSMSAGNAFNQATALQGWMMLNVCSKAWHRDIGWEVSVCMICMGVYSDCMCWNWQFMITIPGRPHVIVSKRYIKELDYSSRIMYIICI